MQTNRPDVLKRIKSGEHWTIEVMDEPGHVDWFFEKGEHQGVVCSARDRAGVGLGLVRANLNNLDLGYFHTVAMAIHEVEERVRYLEGRTH